MQSRINTVAFNGLEILDVDLQVQIASGLPAFTIVGLPDKAVAESRERVRAALQALGLSLPAKRITINLAPADLLKEGSHFDLPVALGLLAGMGIIPQEELAGYVALGELGLDGSIIPVNGILPVAIHANAAEKGLICPAACGPEAVWSGLKDILAADSLLSLINHFKGLQTLPFPQAEKQMPVETPLDMSDVKGQESAKRALEIAAAGGHNLLMIGPPGAGKSMLAARLPSILPPLTAEEALETSMIHSVAGELKDGKLCFSRPYRDPHHSASTPALVGGGRKAAPGEISLAHNGVLFLDELPEFSRTALEALRQPPKCAEEYQSRLSGPLLDRIDIHIEVPAVSPWEMAAVKTGESSAAIRERVIRAREIQKQRFIELDEPQLSTNAQLRGRLLEEVTRLDKDAEELLINFAHKNQLSARAYHRTLRLARTIADLQSSVNVLKIHIAEALSYRRKLPAKTI